MARMSSPAPLALVMRKVARMLDIAAICHDEFDGPLMNSQVKQLLQHKKRPKRRPFGASIFATNQNCTEYLMSSSSSSVGKGAQERGGVNKRYHSLNREHASMFVCMVFVLLGRMQGKLPFIRAER